MKELDNPSDPINILFDKKMGKYALTTGESFSMQKLVSMQWRSLLNTNNHNQQL